MNRTRVWAASINNVNIIYHWMASRGRAWFVWHTGAVNGTKTQERLAYMEKWWILVKVGRAIQPSHRTSRNNSHRHRKWITVNQMMVAPIVLFPPAIHTQSPTGEIVFSSVSSMDFGLPQAKSHARTLLRHSSRGQAIPLNDYLTDFGSLVAIIRIHSLDSLLIGRFEEPKPRKKWMYKSTKSLRLFPSISIDHTFTKIQSRIICH